jgi:3-phosphoshikimate 1-carboxyvinyltransferase
MAEGESRLTGCGRLRLKECDRLAATVETLNLLGGNARAEGDAIVIQGVKALKGGVTLPDYNDHRMVMLGMIAATIAQEPVVVSGVEALNKSWPEFVNVYQNLGGKAE